MGMNNIITVNIENLVERLDPQDYFTFIYLNKEDSFENKISLVERYLSDKVENHSGVVVLCVSQFTHIESLPEILERYMYGFVTKWKHSSPHTTFLDEVSYSRRFQIVFDEKFVDISFRDRFENSYYNTMVV